MGLLQMRTDAMMIMCNSNENRDDAIFLEYEFRNLIENNYSLT